MGCEREDALVVCSAPLLAVILRSRNLDPSVQRTSSRAPSMSGSSYMTKASVTSGSRPASPGSPKSWFGFEWHLMATGSALIVGAP